MATLGISSIVSETVRSVCPVCRKDREILPILSAADYEYGVPGHFVLGRCTSCALHFQIPRPSAKEIDGFYPPGYVTYVESGSPVTRWLTRRYYAREATIIRRLIGRSGRVLDVGCGAGVSLEVFARHGDWVLTGTELDKGSAQAAQRRGLDVRWTPFENSHWLLNGESVDLVRMSHYLEHVRDPLENLAQARRLLKPGGILYLEIPSIESWDFAVWRRYWGALHFPRHLVFPARRHMRTLLREAGLDLVDVRPRFRTCGWSVGIQNFLHDRVGLRVSPVGGRMRWYLLLVALCLPLSLLQALCGRPGAVAYIARK